MKKRIGILNSGGDAPALNTVIDAVVKSVDENYDVIGFYKGFEGLLSKNYIQLDKNYTSANRWIGGTILKSTNKGNFPSSTVSPDTFDSAELEIIEKAYHTYESLGLECLVVLGGDGTLFTANKLQKYGFNVIGVPKSIDNDLNCTDFTFGFQTAVETANDAINKLHTTASSHDRIMILELMGRTAGWIALYAGLAGGANVILLPEMPFNLENLKKYLEERHAKNNSSTIIVVAEASVPTDGDYLAGNFSLSGTMRGATITIGEFLENWINKHTEFEARSTNLGHIQRGGSPIAFDKVIATQLGAYAGKLVKSKMYGKMVAYQNNMINVVDLSSAVLKIKKVDKNDQVVELAKEVGIYFGD
jgi:ATP-dependent phosphofructokinase / diphosphate-dependent phosphofructokinase